MMRLVLQLAGLSVTSGYYGRPPCEDPREEPFSGVGFDASACGYFPCTTFRDCPDPPSGVTARPTCTSQFCVLACGSLVGGHCDTPNTGARCYDIQGLGVGVCLHPNLDDDEGSAAALAVASSAPAVDANASSLKYFGFYDDDIPTTGAFTNFHSASSIPDAIAAHAAGLSVLLLTQDIIGIESRSLKAGYKDRWAAALPTLKELISNGTLFGFNMGDELVWNGLLPSQLVEYAGVIRKDFPRGTATLWYNEAGFWLDGSQRMEWKDFAKHNVSDFAIPEALDWFSIDSYHMDGYVEGWVDAHVRKIYTTQVYPNLTADQKVMLVPGSFGSNVNHYPNGTFICDNSCYDKMCAADAVDFYAWAKSDPKVAAIAPWNWGGCPTCNGSRFTAPHTCCMDEIGTKDQPLTRAAWIKIGKEIKQAAAEAAAAVASNLWA